MSMCLIQPTGCGVRHTPGRWPNALICAPSMQLQACKREIWVKRKQLPISHFPYSAGLLLILAGVVLALYLY